MWNILERVKLNPIRTKNFSLSYEKCIDLVSFYNRVGLIFHTKHFEWKHVLTDFIQDTMET